MKILTVLKNSNQFVIRIVASFHFFKLGKMLVCGERYMSILFVLVHPSAHLLNPSLV